MAPSPPDSLKFWQGVAKHDHFKELAAYALTCLITPASNATVERMFSLVTAIRTKPRNRMQSKVLDAIVRVRSYLLYNGICCKDFICTTKMIQLHNSDNLYSQEETTNNDEIKYLEEVLHYWP